MSVRRLIVEVDATDLNVSEFCRQHGVSRWFFYDLRRRFREQGPGVLEPGSRAPLRVSNKTPGWIEDLIVELRKELNDQGLDAGPATIWTHLTSQLNAGLVPSESTIWRILTRRGFITPDPSKAPKHSYRSFVAERVNECWQIDDTSWTLADDTSVKIINIIDDHSRVVVACQAVVSCTAQAAFDVFCQGAQQWGWPQRFLSDNAPAFRNGLTSTLAQLGISAGHSRPYHPQTCGKVERFHQTLKQWLRARPRAETIHDLQHQLNQFTLVYNHHRPHRSLNRLTPVNVFNTNPKTGPINQPLNTPTKIHRVTIHNGVADINRQYSITIGAAYNHQQATVIITGTNCHVFVAGQLTRQLNLDPTRRRQPLYTRSGKPNHNSTYHQL